MEPAKSQSEISRPTSYAKTFFLWILVLILLIFFLLGVAGSYVIYKRLTDQINHLQSNMAVQQQSLQNVQVAVQNLAQPQMKKASVLSQVDYLLRLAGLHLNVENNTSLAIQLVKIADQEIANLADPSLFPLRRALATDLAQLQATPKIDLAGLVLKINAISQQVADLPLIPSKINEPEKVKNTPPPSSVWKKGLYDVGHALENIIVIRRSPQMREPLLPPQQQAYLTLNIQLKLSEAEWAVLNQQTELYQHNLQQVSDWVRRYFVQNSPLTVSVLKELTELQNITIKSNAPDISNSINMLQDILNNPIKSVDSVSSSL